MRLKQFALSFLGLALLLPCTSLMETAQAGPRGGGGAGRGGAGPSRSAAPSAGGARNFDSRGGDVGVGGGRAGFGAGGVGGPASGIGVRPGLGAGRPGVGAGGVGGPASGVGLLPGAGAGRPGVGAYPAARPGVGYGGVGGPYSGIGVLPGAGAGLPGVPAVRAAGAYGTEGAYAADAYTAEALDGAAAMTTAAAANPSLETGAYAAHPNAWVPRGVLGNSLYANPGYAAVAARLGLAATAIPYAAYGPNAVVIPTTGYTEGSTDDSQQSTDTSNQNGTAGGQADASGDWQPLGVFAMVDGKATTSTDLFQLAVNAQGQIRGNYHNMQDNSILALAGSVDPKTQRAAWTIGGDKLPVYETSVANLTTNEAPMTIHLPDGGQRQFNLVRQMAPQAAK